MGEITARVQQVASSVEKVVVEQAAHVDAAVSEVSKLQAKSVVHAEQLAGNVRGVARTASEKLVFAGEVTGEWAKQVLAATRTAVEAFTKKS